MPQKNEMMLPFGDAPASTMTELAFDADGVVQGSLSSERDTDWIAVELSEGMEYVIAVTPVGADGLADSVLKLMSADGSTALAMNDDADAANNNYSSKLVYTPASGSGTQTYYLSVSASREHPGLDHDGAYQVTLRSADGDHSQHGTAGSDKLDGTELADMIDGLGGHDVIYGHGGDDTLDGGDGADLLAGGMGADTLIGGKGQDYISYLDSDAAVMVTLAAGADAHGGASGGDATGDVFGDDIENVMGSAFGDHITGNYKDNHLLGEGGDDALHGGDGDDTLEGGAGADHLTGGEGENTLSYSSSDAGVTVRLHTASASGGHAEGDTFGDLITVFYKDEDRKEQSEEVPDFDHLVGSAHADILAGDSRDNEIEGGDGDDTLYGGPGGGYDTLEGQAGNDRLYGGHGDDRLDGGDGHDELYGGPGNDVLEGFFGNDILDGGLGDDILEGSFGSDVYVIGLAPNLSDYDQILLLDIFGDASIDSDMIDLSAYDLEPGELAELISINEADPKFDYTLDLRPHGGGTVDINLSFLIDVEADRYGPLTYTGEATDQLTADNLAVAIDANGDGDYNDAGDTAGIFIL